VGVNIVLILLIVTMIGLQVGVAAGRSAWRRWVFVLAPIMIALSVYRILTK
jgi:hypothetical protein